MAKKDVRRAVFRGSLFDSEKARYGTEKDCAFVPKRGRVQNLNKQWEDVEQIMRFTFRAETLQIMNLPVETRLVEPAGESSREGNPKLFSLASPEQKNSRLLVEKPVDLRGTWYVRSKILAFNGHVALSLEDFKHEYSIDQIPVAEVELLAAMLKRGATLAQLLDISKKLEGVEDEEQRKEIIGSRATLSKGGIPWQLRR
jgi:hypothetical protein